MQFGVRKHGIQLVQYTDPLHLHTKRLTDIKTCSFCTRKEPTVQTNFYHTLIVDEVNMHYLMTIIAGTYF